MTWNIAGHEWAVQLLQGHLARNDVRHAYLFCGPPGVGRRTLAIQFTQAINCLKPPMPGEFCGECRVCKQTAAMQHSDLSVLQSEEGTSTIKVEQIRDLQRSLILSPFEARYRIALLLRFHEANQNAQNALLKTLEEAPPKVILLVTADSAESLLPTIVSRCEVLRLRPLSLEHLQRELEKRAVHPEDARLLAHLSSGRLGYALKLKDDPLLMQQRQDYLGDLMDLLTKARRERIDYANKITRDRDKELIRHIFSVWLSFWRDVMLSCASSHTQPTFLPIVNLDMQAEIMGLAERIDLDFARKRVSDLEQAVTRLDGNINARLLTEVLLLDWPRVGLT